MTAFRSLFGGVKPVIGMLHLPALPGSFRGGELGPALDSARADAEAYTAAGVDGMIVENFGDAPFARDRVPATTVAAMAVVCREIRKEHNVPLGVNVLRNDAESALSIAVVTGCDFLRVNVHAGAVVADQGVIEGKARETLMLRRALGSAVLVFADVRVKHAAPLAVDAGRTLVDDARETFGRGGADALILSGRATGTPADARELRAVRDALPEAPLLVGSGVSEDNLEEFWPLADGWIVGSALKRAGDVNQPVDPDRTRSFVGKAASLRRSARPHSPGEVS